MDAIEAARAILAAHRNGDEIVSVLLAAGTRAGARVLVRPDGSIVGSLGDPDLDAAAAALAARVYQERVARAADDLFAELYVPAQQLLIFGAGHIAVPLAELGVRLGFQVTVLDDRTEFAEPSRFDANVQVRQLDYTEPLRDIRLDMRSYVVLVTRAHQYDFDCLRVILAQAERPRYIGMIGSKRRVRAAFTALQGAGVAQELLASVHAPIGIDIGAETPAEIAVSIAAEIIREMRGSERR